MVLPTVRFQPPQVNSHNGQPTREPPPTTSAMICLSPSDSSSKITAGVVPLSIFHRFQENVLESVATEIKAADPHIALGGDPVNVTNLDSVSEDHLQPVRCRGTLAAKLFDRFGEVAVGAVKFQLEKSFVGLALLLQVRVVRNPPLLEDQHFFAC